MDAKPDISTELLQTLQLEVTKERIISLCQERFFKEGFSRISIDEIAADLAMSKKTLYKYFSSKEDIVQQIMERFTGNIRSGIERILLSDRSAVEKLSGIITMLAADTGRLTPAFGQDIQRRMPHLWKHIEAFRRQRISDVISRLIAQGVDEGTIRPDIHKRLFLLCVLNVIDGILQPHVLVHESFSLSEAVQEILKMFFKGGLTQKGRDHFEQLQHS